MQVKPIKIFVFIFCLMTATGAYSQTLKTKLTNAVNGLRNDSQMTNGIMSLYVIDRETGKVVYDYNSRMGLSPASTQKVITATTAYETLGKDFRYETKFMLETSRGDTFVSNIIVRGSGDPTFGSWRYTNTQRQTVITNIKNELNKLQYKIRPSGVTVYINNKDNNPLPGGYIWKDAGNYYGAGHFDLNWNENQYDIFYNTNGDDVKIKNTDPALPPNIKFFNYLQQGTSGSGDQSVMYSVPYSKEIFLYGSIPEGQKAFKVSGSLPNPAEVFLNELQFPGSRIIKDSVYVDRFFELPYNAYDSIYTHYSPTLDSINYWFLKKSVNLYGEALIKTIAQKTSGKNGTEAGTEAVRNFWKTRGIPENELKMEDGSGLSPQNKITTHALVTALQYATNKTWFTGFYDALPIYNDIKMKSGTIGGCKGFTGYTTKYIFAIIINNYNGTHTGIVKKMYSVLDNLK